LEAEKLCRFAAPVGIDNFVTNDHSQPQSFFNRRLPLSRWAPMVALALLCVSIGILAEALQTATTSQSTKTSSSSVLVTDQDNGRDVDLTTGASLIVKLTSNPSTGYSWALSGDASPLRLVKSTYVKNPPSSKIVGTMGMQVFRLSASAAGMARLKLVYRRSWEYNVPPVKTFSLRVNVR
jgi:inhibitor of cysteine peptidase